MGNSDRIHRWGCVLCSSGCRCWFSASDPGSLAASTGSLGRGLAVSLCTLCTPASVGRTEKNMVTYTVLNSLFLSGARRAPQDRQEEPTERGWRGFLSLTTRQKEHHLPGSAGSSAWMQQDSRCGMRCARQEKRCERAQDAFCTPFAVVDHPKGFKQRTKIIIFVFQELDSASCIGNGLKGSM